MDNSESPFLIFIVGFGGAISAMPEDDDDPLLRILLHLQRSGPQVCRLYLH